MQDPALGLFEPHEAHTGPLSKLVQVPLDGMRSLRYVDRIIQLGMICRLAEGVVDPTVCVTDEDFFSILPAGGRGSARNRHIMSISSWLRGWCHSEGFDFYDNGTFFNNYNLLERDGIHLSRKGKGIFGNRLVNLVWRALN